jgi:hypothetical protein
MNRTDKFEEPEIEQAIDKHCQPNHKEIGRIAVETPPIYFTPLKDSEPFGYDDMGTYLARE